MKMCYLNVISCICLFVTLNILIASCQQLSKYLNNPCSFNLDNFNGTYKKMDFNCTTLPPKIYPNKIRETINGQEVTYFCCPYLRVSEQFCNANKYTILKKQIAVGNTVDIIGSIPYIAALFRQEAVRSDSDQFKYQQFCGGSIISEWYILTAAHCFFDNDQRKYDYFAGLGMIDITNVTDANLYRVAVIKEHWNYHKIDRQQDIALIKLEKQINDWPLHIKPICLHSYGVNNGIFDEMKLQISGWGRYHKRISQSSTELREGKVSYVNQAYCKGQYPNRIIESQFCASSTNRTNTCIGDSGGPIDITFNEIHYLVGIISHASGCGALRPDIHTRVLYFIDWIEENVWLSLNDTGDQQLLKYLNSSCTMYDNNFVGTYMPKTLKCSTLPTEVFPNKTIETINGTQQIYFCCPESRVSEQACNAYKKIEELPSSTHKTNTPVDIPYIAALFSQKKSFEFNFRCSGSIISEWFILTSANCVDNEELYYFVIIGKTNIENVSVKDLLITDSIHLDSNYNNATKQPDIALVKMKEKIIFTNFIISPICLNSYKLNSDRVFQENAKLKISGWERYIPTNEIQFNDACDADSGNGVAAVINQSSILVKIMSYENVCTRKPVGVYTAILPFLDWIERTVWLNHK